MKAKYLFLDFDGVLHPSLCNDNDRFSKVNLLNQTFTSSSCQIIISSSWRFQFTLDQLKKMLPVSISNLVIDATGEALNGPYARFNEIKHWLESKQKPFSDWKALDDATNEFPPDCPNLIATKSSQGITKDQIIELKQWLD
ncbi:hypothetical protein FIT69_04585 [Candidatus Methylopumilus planktonicus]|uniref:HAD domain-containing protein n=1 Tax=Candidatus Methylopumilus planktonicus TaxID=1581557 RepID=UPI001120188B|nr:HAD domain-containing protein [Candidatus Methylopumilus planktonicus]QDD01844.1 hypothetical protein FIT69_04585 [Candidatus Methylopumilus planktonicus]